MKREHWNIHRVHELVAEQGVTWSIEETEKRIKSLKQSLINSASEDVCSYLLKDAESPTIERAPLKFIVGDELKELCQASLQKKRRNAYDEMTEFLDNTELHNKLGVVYGLRNTGKTVILQQLAGHPDRVDKSAYISLKYRQCKVWELEKPIGKLMEKGYKYFYLDEVSWAESFVDQSMGLSDLFTPVKIVLSGTDSLSFRLAANDTLYHRVVFTRTTWMPFDEYCRITENPSILQYLMHGGVFWEDKTATNIKKYIETSIVDNIYNTIRNVDREYVGRDLLLGLTKRELYNIVYGICESVTLENLLEKVHEHWDKEFAKGLEQALRSCGVRLGKTSYGGLIIDSYPYEITSTKYSREKVLVVLEYLQKLNLLANVGYFLVPRINTMSLEFTQLGILQEFTRNVVGGILKNVNLSTQEKESVLENLTSNAEGGQLEAVVLLSLTNYFSKNKDRVKVFKVRQAGGDFEFDAVVYSYKVGILLIEVKRTDKQKPSDTRHLKNPVALDWVKVEFGEVPITKIVLYRGETQVPEGDTADVYFINIEDFLLNMETYLKDFNEIIVKQLQTSNTCIFK